MPPLEIADVTQKDLLKRSAQKKLLTFKKNDHLFRENEEAAQVFFIKTGKVKIIKHEGTEQSIILNIAASGEILGIHAVVNNHPYSNSAIALSKTTAYSIPADEFRWIVKNEIGLQLLVMKHLCAKIDLLESRMAKTGRKRTSQRLAETLVSLVKEHGLDSENCIKLSLEPADLAELVGTSKEYLYKKLHEFYTDGLLSIDSGKLKILSLERLEKAAGLPVSGGAAI